MKRNPEFFYSFLKRRHAAAWWEHLLPAGPETYDEFLKGKITVAQQVGFEISDKELHPGNKPHQNAMIRWAASLGRSLLAASFGSGKTRMQCELARLIVSRTGKPFLVICPLGVKYQFQQEDGPMLGMSWTYIRDDGEATKAIEAGQLYLITNYDRVREANITSATIDHLGGVSLDEGSVLRSLGSKTQTLFNIIFRTVPYRFVATATPAPNAYRELLNYAEFLQVMDRGQALTRWFQRNPDKAGDLQLHPQYEEAFWLWVSSWALFLFRPSDLGYSDEGYDLPKLNVHWHRLDVDHSRAWAQVDNYGQRRLILDGAAGVSEASQETRETLVARLEKAKEIMAENPGRHWLIWHHLENERRAIEKAIPESTSVYGSQTIDERERRIMAFAHGEIPILATKPDLAGSGCNFQYHCHSNIFLGIDPAYRFNDMIQAVHRTWRFQQQHEVDVHVIYPESMDQVVRVMQEKWARHDLMVEKMRGIVRQYGLSRNAILRGLNRRIGVKRAEVKGRLFRAIHNDCVLETQNMPDNSVGMICTSIPFSKHYEYSDQYEDFGHNSSDARFWEQMDYLLPNLLRVLKPGRIAVVHTKDLIHYGHQTEHGFMEIYPFHMDCVAAFKKHGFMYMGKHTITTDVVRENNSTNRLGYGEMTKDATKMGAGLPEELLIFRKQPSTSENARADEPVTKVREEYSLARWQLDANEFWRSNGNRLLFPDEIYDYEQHVARLEELEVKGHLPRKFMIEPPVSISPWVWDDVNQMSCLNGKQSQKRQRNHICPLPFDIVQRAIRLYSCPGDVVLDPFSGLFTVVMKAVEMGREGWGVELNSEYWKAGVGYCQEAETKVTSPTLFDLLKYENRNSILTGGSA